VTSAGWAGRAMSVTSPSYSGPPEESVPIQAEQNESLVSLQRGGNRVSQFSWLLLGFGLYSYRVREILVCWLFFSGMLAALGLLVTGGILVWHGGKWVLDWTSPLIPIAPKVDGHPGELVSGQSRTPPETVQKRTAFSVVSL
jgi:pheromone shutdown protein TraB